MRAGLLDYGSGNLGSVLKALAEAGADPVLVSRPEDLAGAGCLVLPGVGAFGDCRARLDAGGFTEPLVELVRAGRPLLGICVGMQLLATSGAEGGSGEGDAPGLCLVPGRVESLRVLGCPERVPHVGWNAVTAAPGPAGEILSGIPDGTDFYFTHSYMFVPDDPAAVAGTAPYGLAVTAAVRAGHVWGTQFHPEKSSRAGLRVIRNFVERAAC